MPWKHVPSPFAGKKPKHLQFGHGCDAVETGTPVLKGGDEGTDLQFGHGCDAVETPSS